MVLLIVIALNQTGIAQDVIIKSVEKRYTADVFYELFTENDIWDNAKLRIRSFLEVDLAKLEKAANEIDAPPEIERTTMYIQKDKFRVDNESVDGGKLTFLFRKDLGMMYQINWDEKTVMEMSVESSKQMAREFQDKTDVIQTKMEEVLKNVPPDQRKEMKEAMKASGLYEDSDPSKKSKPQVTKTGRKKDIHAFPQCEEYRVVYGDQNMALWVTGSKPRLIKMMNQIEQEFLSSFGMDDEDDLDPWKLLPDKFPALIITFEDNMMSGIQFKVEEILSATVTTIPPETFNEFKNSNLKKVSMMGGMKKK
jgi:hypothetical protein